MTYIAIASIATSTIFYCGTCLYTAANWLEPGTCWAKGEHGEEAKILAKRQATSFREHGYEGSCSHDRNGLVRKLQRHNYHGSTQAL